MQRQNLGTSYPLVLFLAVSEEAKTCIFFFQYIINLSLNSVFVISIIIKVLVRVIHKPQPLASANNPYLNLDYSGYN